LLHDIGEIDVPDHILNKLGRLTQKFEFVKHHPEFGCTITRKLPGTSCITTRISTALVYPAHLKGSEIRIGSRIVSVIDAFDAMGSSRLYRKGLPMDEVIRRLLEVSGTQFKN
jgi:HD-GYP domain-containing protein (c-di-GMP phosphodiesterase class II)